MSKLQITQLEKDDLEDFESYYDCADIMKKVQTLTKQKVIDPENMVQEECTIRYALHRDNLEHISTFHLRAFCNTCNY